MKRFVFTALTIMCMFISSVGTANGQTYDSMWKQVEKYQADDLPRQVLLTSQSIYNKARKEHNFSQQMKAWVSIVESRMSLDPDSFDVSQLPEVETVVPAHKAIYHALLATAYEAARTSHTIRYDADTQQEYEQAIRTHISLALAQRDALAREVADDYLPLLRLGDDSRLYNHDLLSVIARFVTDHTHVLSGRERYMMHADLAQFYQDKGLSNAWALQQLEYLQGRLQYGTAGERLNIEQYYDELRTLLGQTQDIEAGADVALALLPGIGSEDEQIEFIAWAERQFAHSKLLPEFINLDQQLHNPRCNITIKKDTDTEFTANRPVTFSIDYHNTQQLVFEVRQYNGVDKNRRLRTDGHLVDSHTYTLGNDSANHARHAKGLPIKGTLTDSITLGAGHYVLVGKAAGSTDVTEMRLTTLQLFTYQMPADQWAAVVLNNLTGRPVQGAIVSYKESDSEVEQRLTTDADGMVIIKSGAYIQELKASIDGTDDQTNSIGGLGRTRNWTDRTVNIRTRLYTDRAIYRPGQTVHVAGIIYSQQHDTTHTLPDTTITLTLTDANGETISTQEATTNQWGVLSADFILPTDRMPGDYRVLAPSANVGFSVEEYKRPTFTVKAKVHTDASSAEREYTFGDTMQVEILAQTYSGVPVQGATVRYKIEGSRTLWRGLLMRYWQPISEGTTHTDDDGLATISMLLTDSLLVNPDEVMNYRITFDVTSISGETHTDIFTTSVSRRGFNLTIDMPNHYDLASDHDINILAHNAQGQELEVDGHYYIYRYQPSANDLYQHDDDALEAYVSTAHKVAEGQFNTHTPLSLPHIDAGQYQLYVVSHDAHGNKIHSISTFLLYDASKATPLHGRQAGATTQYDDVLLDAVDHDYTFAEGHPAQILFSSNATDVYLNYVIYTSSTIVKRQSVVVGRDLRKLTIDYRPEYGDGVELMLFYVKDGKPYMNSLRIIYRKPEKELKLSWHTFRDHLTPGQAEEWILSVANRAGRPVNGASVMATLYDASLDALRPHAWSMYIDFPRYFTNYGRNMSTTPSAMFLNLNGEMKMQDGYQRQWDELTTYVNGIVMRPVMYRMMATRAESAAVASEQLEITDVDRALEGRVAGLDIIKSAAYNSVGAITDVTDGSDITSEESAANSSSKSSTMRTNLAETAYFAPHLLTDADGYAHIKFTLPESLTQWNFIGMAHTTDMDYGRILGSATASKDFMVQPNMPRFVRNGDHADIVASIINRTDQTIEANVSFRLLDAETQEEVYAESKTVSIGASATEAVGFSFIASDLHPMLVCEIRAESDHFSDGERNYLPVLSSKRFVTETVPFYLAAGETSKQVDLSALFGGGSSTATQRRMVVEYTANPAWTVVQALEAVKIPERNDAISLAAALYSNSTAQCMATSVPGLQQAVMEQKVEPKSELDMDDDLRDIIQQESPWMRAARHEARQRAELVDFFNPALMATRIDQSATRLQALQQADGSWSWFEGMTGSHYVTLAVCEMLAMLRAEDMETSLMRGMAFLDAKELEWYNERRRTKQAITPTESTLNYLYVCSLMPERKVSKAVTDMRNAYLKELEKSSRQLSIYGKANGSTMLRAFGRVKSADKLLQSVVEYTVTKPGMGRYYATDRALYSWRDYRIPTHLAAMRAISSSARADRQQLVADMQLWLIREKQVQMWDNPMNTIAAVGFLLTEPTQFGSPAAMPTMAIDGKELDMQTDTLRQLAGPLGFVRTQVTDPQTTDGVSALSIGAAEAPTHLGYGAVYAQFLDDTDAMSANASGEIRIDRTLMVDGRAVDPSTTTLHVGDKVTIRLTISADRDIDFLQVRTGHAACLEPTQQLSGYRWMGGRGGYVSMHDASTDVFFDRFTRGTTTFDIQYHVTRQGTYLADIATAQCAYAPEFGAHTGAITLNVK